MYSKVLPLLVERSESNAPTREVQLHTLVISIFGEMIIPSISTLQRIARDSMTNKKFTIMMGHTHIGNKEELSLLDSKA